MSTPQGLCRTKAGLSGLVANRALRPMQASDLDAVLRIQQQCYPEALHESHATLSAKQCLAPDWCWVASHEATVQAYVFAHPWHDGAPPELDRPLPSLPEPAGLLFIHDLAVHPAARGLGLARILTQQLYQQADQHGLAAGRLIAIPGASDYWHQLGFKILPFNKLIQDKLQAYGKNSAWMEIKWQMK